MQGPRRGEEGIPTGTALHQAATVRSADNARGGARPGLPGESRPAIKARPSDGHAAAIGRPELHQRVRQLERHERALLRQLVKHLGRRAVPEVRPGHFSEHGVGTV